MANALKHTAHAGASCPTAAPEAPDVATASDAYRLRFRGATGQYFLEVQERCVVSLLDSDGRGKTVLEVGGAHAQLTEAILARGCSVWVHATDEKCFARLKAVQERYPGRLELVTSPLDALPFAEGHFDAVVAIRLLTHVEEWSGLLREMCRVSKGLVVFDYPPVCSFNFFYPILFALKYKLEGGSTRTFIRFSAANIRACLTEAGFRVKAEHRQFFLPMGFHRTIRCAPLSRALEGISAAAGLVRLFGAPAVLCAERSASPMRY